MAMYLILALALLGSAFGRKDDLCPEDKEISPCTCDGEGVNCMEAKSLDDINNAFSVKFPYGGVKAVWVQGTPIKSLTAGLFGKVFTQQFYIEQNDIETVDMEAFRASRDVLAILSLYGNKIVNFPYSDIDNYPKLASINLGGNLIETIPANAFSHAHLQSIILAQNKIKSVGMHAFSDARSLMRLDLMFNQIRELGALSFSMRQSQPQLQINLAFNNISEISGSAFQGTEPLMLSLSANKLTSLKSQPFESLIVKIAMKGGFMEVADNPFSCRGCDYSWLALNKRVLANLFVGFECTDGRTMHDLTRSNIKCY